MGLSCCFYQLPLSDIVKKECASCWTISFIDCCPDRKEQGWRWRSCCRLPAVIHPPLPRRPRRQEVAATADRPASHRTAGRRTQVMRRMTRASLPPARKSSGRNARDAIPSAFRWPVSRGRVDRGVRRVVPALEARAGQAPEGQGGRPVDRAAGAPIFRRSAPIQITRWNG